ncbi:hypothetical protein TcWFU_001714 [Taenia crassiceps]|uniref:Uncharacterized protein n=1 Tax=Taenia crassiceps TaxID=6207 RepID=A0ABR4Q2P5_9CEST
MLFLRVCIHHQLSHVPWPQRRSDRIGQLGINPATMELVGPSIEQQTQQALKNLFNIVKECGGQARDVVKTTVLLTDMENFAAVNKIYAKFIAAFTTSTGLRLLRNINAPELELRYVHEVYDAIAESFSDSRYAPWPGVLRFLRSLPSGSWGADIGCGNDFFICVAVLHHLSTPQRRLEGLQSVASLLKVGGLGLIQVWAKDQHWEGQKTAYLQSGKSDSGKADVLLPWNASKKKAGTATKVEVMRYYHVFEAKELEDLIAQVPCLELIESSYEQGNWSAIVRKIEPNLGDNNGGSSSL